MPHVPGEKDLTISTIVLCSIFVIVLCAILTVIIRSAIRKRKQRTQDKGVIEATLLALRRLYLQNKDSSSSFGVEKHLPLNLFLPYRYEYVKSPSRS
ncbi:uncharacterized protein LOC6592360 isoform X11 [Drosophila persimilis]|uniref:uncharacterized protein LOC6592360 isoform X11 n=1 Tax=Drosophila persimilis TaxID=7234 RepID=UPI000F08A7A1|nr:uncharacterized protein LOC6592360 isoform X11 [Drosophila persimilis]